jgi:hypothetical protein
MSADIAWWRPQPAAPVGTMGAVGQASPREGESSRIAFGALVAFTVILLLAPQSFLPVLKVFRIALVAATIAILGHIFDATIRHRPIVPAIPEIGITLTLLAWTVLTIPFSYWPGGSIAVLTDSYLKAIVFFWLIGTLVTTEARLRVFAWTLALCSMPLAAMALQHYLDGDFLYTGVADGETHFGLLRADRQSERPRPHAEPDHPDCRRAGLRRAQRDGAPGGAGDRRDRDSGR